MTNFVTTLMLLFLGMILRRISLFPKDTALTLNLYVIYVALPALVLAKVPKLVFSADILAPILMPWAMLLVSTGMVLIGSRIYGWEEKTTGALLLLVPLGNTSFLGIPMVEAFWGSDQVIYAVLYDQLGSFMALATYGAVVLAVYSGGERPTPGGVVKKILTFPPFVALSFALATLPLAYPKTLQSMFEIIAASLVPVVMVAVGFQLRLRMAPGNFVPFSFGLAVKLVLAPLLALWGCKLAGLDNLAANVAVFEAGMPPMVTAGALASIAGLAPELAAALVGYGILLSFVTLPLLYQFF